MAFWKVNFLRNGLSEMWPFGRTVSPTTRQSLDQTVLILETALNLGGEHCLEKISVPISIHSVPTISRKSMGII